VKEVIFRIMKIPTPVLLSAVLVITSLTTMAMPTFNATITNFPLDEQGNLKVAPSGPLRTYNTSVSVPVLEWVSGRPAYHTGWGSQGLTFANAPKARATIPFTFNPHATFLRITDFWISVSILDMSGKFGCAGRFQFEIIFNNKSTYNIFEEGLQTGRTHLLTRHIADVDVIASIIPSINTITLANPSVYVLPPIDIWYYDYSVNVYTITIYIE